MKTARISASIMCSDLLHMESSLAELERAGVDFVHCDIMDGHFVPNITLGNDLMKAIRKVSSIPLDIHLMIEAPESRLDWIDAGRGDIVSVHVESTRHLHRSLDKIRSKGARAAAALNPATSLDCCDYILDDVDMILLMTVNPGYAGQKLVESTIGKIADLRDYLIRKSRDRIEIEVDGNVSFVNARRMRDAGADVFVAGSSSVFAPDLAICEAVTKLRERITMI